jgi:uncharacterized protein (DUF1697 family)
MGRQVALLRGINVGRAKRIAMADLRTLVQSLGYTDVRSLLNSGNVIFDSNDPPARAASRIATGVRDRLGITSRVIVLTADDIAAIAKENTLAVSAADPTRLLVAVVGDPSHLSRLQPLARQDWGSDALVIGRRAAYISCPDGILKSKLLEAVGRALGDGVTTRNWATFTKIRVSVG